LSELPELAANAHDHRRGRDSAFAVADLVAKPIATDEPARGDDARGAAVAGGDVLSSRDDQAAIRWNAVWATGGAGTSCPM
jgi:hypothetical protein